MRHAWLIITYACNNRCTWCYTGEQEQKSMSLELAYPSLDLLVDLGVENIGFNICLPSLSAPNQIDSCISPIEAAKIIESLYIYGKGRGVKIKSITPLPLCNFSPEIRKDMLRNKRLNTLCQMYTGSALAIDMSGDIFPCVHWSDYPLGNIKDLDGDSFIRFWEEQQGLPSKFREALAKYPTDKCADDNEFWGKCIGGCPIFWLNYVPKNEIRGLIYDKFHN